MKRTETFMLILGLLVVLGFFALVAVIILVEIKISNKEVLYLVAGGLIGSFNNIIGYYFGSSHGSKVKTDMMNENNKPNATNNSGSMMLNNDALG